MRRIKPVALLALLVGILTVALGVVPASASGGRTTGTASFTCTGTQNAITAVTVNASTIVVTGTTANPCPDQVRIYGLDQSAANSSWSSGSPLATITPAANGTYSASFARMNGSADRMYLKYVAVAVNGATATLIAGPYHATTLSFTPVNDDPRYVATSQKGMSVSMTGDAEELGIQHAAISIAADRLMQAGPGAAGETIPFVSQGTTYYFSTSFAESLDRRIKPLSDNGVLVYLVLVLIYETDANSSLPMLRHPDAPTGDPGGFVTYAFNTKTAAGIAAFTALIEFIADRYTRDDQTHGRAMDYIVGNEIQSAGIWQIMGPKTPAQFVDAYAPALRLAWNAAQKYSAGTRVYTSLDRLWNDSAMPSDPTRFYEGRDILDRIAAKAKAEGDYPWHLAFHPYPHDMFSPLVWNDPVTADPLTTDEITFKNIAALTAYMNTTPMRFGGTQRHIILSEQACQSPTNSAADQNLQAACFAYAYYKVLAAGGIDAFLWDPQVDNRHASGLRMGLWTWDDNRPGDPIAPGSKKQVYAVFRDIDTPNSMAVTNFAKAAIGISNWTAVIPNWTDSMVDDRVPATAMPVVVGGTGVSPTIISGFESGLGAWRTADAASSLQTVAMADAPGGSNALRIAFDDPAKLTDNSRNSKAWHGADVVLATPLNATSKSHLGVSVLLDPVSASVYNTYSVQVRAYGADGTIAYGTGTISPADGWTTVHVDLSGWAGRSAIERIKIWVKGSYGDDWFGSIAVDDVALYSSVTAPTRLFDFESTTQGWVAGSNVSSVSRVTSFPNAPGVPHRGSGVLEAVMSNVNASSGRTVSVTTPINATGADSVFVWMNGYGGVSGATGYQATVTLRSAGGRVVSTTTLVNPDTWNKVSVDVSDWPYKASITGIDVSYRALGTTATWSGSPRLQIDDIGVVTGTAPAQTKTVLYAFESNTQGWVAGTGSSGVARVTSFPNGPTTPFEGSASLEVAFASAAANTRKAASVTPGSPLNLSTATSVYAWVDGYGGLPDATGYSVDITVYSGTESITGTNSSFVPDAWNKVSVDVRGWALRSAITKIEITYRVQGSTFAWGTGPRMQIDEVGYFVPTTAPPAPTSLFTFESNTQGWVAGTNVSSVARVTSFPNGPGVPHGGAYALQATMANGNAGLPKTITVTPGTPIDLSSARALAVWFDGYGGIPGAAGYDVQVTLWSGTHSTTGRLADYLSDRWSRVIVDVDDWPYRGSVTKIDVTYRALGTSFTWTGGPKFQIDDIVALY